MSSEIQPERKLSKSTRKHIRGTKSEIRAEIGVIQPSPDTDVWNKTEEILRLKLPEYGEKFAAHTSILRDFCEVRQKIKLGGFQQELVKEFQAKYDQESLKTLSPAFRIIIEIVGRR